MARPETESDEQAEAAPRPAEAPSQGCHPEVGRKVHRDDSIAAPAWEKKSRQEPVPQRNRIRASVGGHRRPAPEPYGRVATADLVDWQLFEAVEQLRCAGRAHGIRDSI